MDATALAARLLEPIPANVTCGIEIVRAAEGAAEVALEPPDALANVIGSLHASGLVALLDATGLAAIVAAVHDEREFDGIVPLGSAARVEFLRPARGRLTGRCTLSQEAHASLRALFAAEHARARISTTVEIGDRDDLLVCRGSFDWSVRRVGVQTPR
jgi:acyl-coenzyme A thioesterase PaaI-like protein